MSLRQKANRLIKPPKNRSDSKFRKGEGTTKDIINVILFADKHSAPTTEKFAKVFESMETENQMYQLWKFVRKEIRYKADKAGHERVKSPAKTWKDRYADCKSMSIFIGSILQNLNIPYSYRFVAWYQNENLSHVYIIAHTKEGDFILDAVYDKFNEEEKYAYKKDIKRMTEISYVHGLESSRGDNDGSLQSVFTQPTDPFRIDDSPKKVTSPRPFNYPALSEGEFSLLLMDRKLEILQNYYGDKSGDIQKARNLIFQAISNDVHKGVNFTGSIPPSLNEVAREINRVKNMRMSAVSTSSREAQAAIGLLVKGVNCREKYGELELDSDGRYYLEIPPGNTRAYNECVAIMRYRDLLNDHYEKASHHVLYEFLGNTSQEPSVVQTKALLQKAALSQLSTITGISRANFRKWTDVGIMWHNSTRSELGPLAPEDTIKLIKNGHRYNNIPKVGAAITLAGVIAVVKVLIAAYIAVNSQIMRSKEIQARLKVDSFGTPELSADTYDFNQNGIPDNQETGNPSIFKSSALPLLLIGGGAFVMLNDK